jgi:hypothetical protein
MPFAKRTGQLHSFVGFESPDTSAAPRLVKWLARYNMAMLFYGDSMSAQPWGALTCELERNGFTVVMHKQQEHFVCFEAARSVSGMNSTKGRRESVHICYKHGAIGAPWAFYKADWAAAEGTIDYLSKDLAYDGVALVANHGKRSMLRRLIQGVIMFAGLHFNQNDKALMLEHTPLFLAWLKQIAMDTTRRNVVIWRDTTPQHFPSPSGYFVEHVEGEDSLPYNCLPIANQSSAVDWRNKIPLNELSTGAYDPVELLEIHDTLEPFWDMHHHSGDCTHFCYSPVLWQPMWHRLYRILERNSHSRNTSRRPLS